jgi:hypothetical protein
MAEQFSNNIGSQLAVDMTTVSTSVTVAATTGFPSTPQFRIKINKELMLVPAMTGTVLTVTRGIEGTTPAAYIAGAVVNHVMSAGGLTQAITDAVAGRIGFRSTSGLLADLPGTAASGDEYWPTDTSVIYRSNGTSWQAINWSTKVPLGPPSALP